MLSASSKGVEEWEHKTEWVRHHSHFTGAEIEVQRKIIHPKVIEVESDKIDLVIAISLRSCHQGQRISFLNRDLQKGVCFRV